MQREQTMQQNPSKRRARWRRSYPSADNSKTYSHSAGVFACNIAQYRDCFYARLCLRRRRKALPHYRTISNSKSQTHDGVRVTAQRCNTSGVSDRLLSDNFGADSGSDVTPVVVVVAPRRVGVQCDKRRWVAGWEVTVSLAVRAPLTGRALGFFSQFPKPRKIPASISEYSDQWVPTN